MKDASVPSPLRMAGVNQRSLMQLIIQSSSSSFTPNRMKSDLKRLCKWAVVN
ncbi:hypothetical protein PQG02_20520 [Nostoc sp. UHCC 0926]|uniref:hypothetical protein n=1 Tax=unclassified Nostoc TaxID=2593658 RepID=UPI002362BAC1|nr:hypothetical protein [Nostoc sp. UHCC 0926]WDD31103.1 hypothetical protein PQG02_20520 [Nostoc sp. UHCC 0926]